MSDRAPTKASAFLTFSLRVFLVVMVVTAAVTYTWPQKYAGTARLRFSEGGAAASVRTNFQVMVSAGVLTNVIQRLDLNVRWGKIYVGGLVLMTPETMALLQSSLTLAAEADGRILDLTAYSKDKHEAAAIANAVAAGFLEERKKLRGPGTGEVFVLQDAVPGEVPATPNKQLWITVGGTVAIVLGLAAGCFAVRMRKGRA